MERYWGADEWNWTEVRQLRNVGRQNSVSEALPRQMNAMIVGRRVGRQEPATGELEYDKAWRLPASEVLPGQITGRTAENEKGRGKPATVNLRQCEGTGELS